MMKSLAAVLALALALPGCEKANGSKPVVEAPKASTHDSIQIEVTEANFRSIVRLEKKIRAQSNLKDPNDFADWRLFGDSVFNPMLERMNQRFGREQVAKWHEGEFNPNE